MANKSKRKGEDSAVLALAGGADVRHAAATAGIGERTLHRWLKTDPAFRQRVDEARDELFRSTFGALVASGAKAVEKLTKLLNAESEQVQLGAARAILEHMSKGREQVELTERVAELERRITEGRATCGNDLRAA
ncbi:hypothetical protein [Pseudobythopirellula maris]|uniref:hypothetical protein n=1 Tax=Pseudobythopirellula maris TaxID=2527991 RepID=UPI0011B4370A|nr:hypothetical protein [Pseudobythopirellula maris]